MWGYYMELMLFIKGEWKQTDNLEWSCPCSDTQVSWMIDLKMSGYEHYYFNEKGIQWRLDRELSWENKPDGNDVSWLLLRD